MKTYNFKVVIERDEDFDGKPSGWHAFCPALNSLGGSTGGETREQALEKINEVVHMIVDELIAEGKPEITNSVLQRNGFRDQDRIGS